MPPPDITQVIFQSAQLINQALSNAQRVQIERERMQQQFELENQNLQLREQNLVLQQQRAQLEAGRLAVSVAQEQRTAAEQPLQRRVLEAEVQFKEANAALKAMELAKTQSGDSLTADEAEELADTLTNLRRSGREVVSSHVRDLISSGDLAQFSNKNVTRFANRFTTLDDIDTEIARLYKTLDPGIQNAMSSDQLGRLRGASEIKNDIVDLQDVRFGLITAARQRAGEVLEGFDRAQVDVLEDLRTSLDRRIRRNASEQVDAADTAQRTEQRVKAAPVRGAGGEVNVAATARDVATYVLEAATERERNNRWLSYMRSLQESGLSDTELQRVIEQYATEVTALRGRNAP